MLASLLALSIVAVAASGLALRSWRLFRRTGGGCAGCSLARPNF